MECSRIQRLKYNVLLGEHPKNDSFVNNLTGGSEKIKKWTLLINDGAGLKFVVIFIFRQKKGTFCGLEIRSWNGPYFLSSLFVWWWPVRFTRTNWPTRWKTCKNKFETSSYRNASNVVEVQADFLLWLLLLLL